MVNPAVRWSKVGLKGLFKAGLLEVGSVGSS